VAGLAVLLVGAKIEAAGLFDDHSVLEAELQGPLYTLIDSDPEADEFPFSLLVGGRETPVTVRLRGKSRLRVCKFPPLRFEFGAAAESLFSGQHKLKLVTHCRDHDRAEQDLLQEYLAYRIFNEISGVSYRVRLLRITYSDLDGELDVGTRYAFLIESKDELGDRVGGSAIDVTGVSRGSLDPQQAAMVYVFQFLIGNTDWSIVMADGDDSCCHNVDLFAGDSGIYLVPYDFDLSGIVNARYAKPDSSLRIPNVRRRLYRGYCTPPDAMRQALEDIVDKEAEVTAMVGRVPGLSDKAASEARKYIGKFFERAADQEDLLEYFEHRCL
jgi:hypothetical protein